MQMLLWLLCWFHVSHIKYSFSLDIRPLWMITFFLFFLYSAKWQESRTLLHGCLCMNCSPRSLLLTGERYDGLHGKDLISHIWQLYQSDSESISSRFVGGKGNTIPASRPLQSFDKDTKAVVWETLNRNKTKQLLQFDSFFSVPLPSLSESYLWLKWLTGVLTWANRCGPVHHMQIKTQRCTCAFAIMRNLKRLKGRLTIYMQYCKPRITDDTLKETLQVNGGKKTCKWGIIWLNMGRNVNIR